MSKTSSFNLKTTSQASRKTIIQDEYCERPTKCNPCGESNYPVCGTKNPNLTCRPAGRSWGRACGPVFFCNGKWITPPKKRLCRPISVRGKNSRSMPYGFGLYARKIYPFGLPCIGSCFLQKPQCNEYFYPMLPTKPGKIYSTYTFNTRGPPYNHPLPCTVTK
ncbi:hypothetical protein PVAND_009103 [Polypedilum vanderplanki]|uniref:Uncharacterized protein n=1 Tax=Polypedilum vanderplanki TaxID=319348 RepID=A0A9J6CC28_POLVA|nr:hypothetical protein PVAND_009103 [Polypedilum vanderplanki]